jgi:hypothetical protein
MQCSRLTRLISLLEERGACIDLREYRKAKLIIELICRKSELTTCNFEAFMEKADILEASIYERVKVQAISEGYVMSEAELQNIVLKEIKNHLDNIPALSAT